MFITSTEIASYIKTSVAKVSDNRQMPQLKSLSSDSEADFVFLRVAPPESEGATKK